jgi:hypothetical protein
MSRIKNIRGTSDNDCKCSSWIAHWEKYSEQRVLYCAEASCLNTENIVGAHVQKVGADNNWYIIPLCKKHNAEVQLELEISNAYNFVSANKAETCEK